MPNHSDKPKDALLRDLDSLKSMLQDGKTESIPVLDQVIDDKHSQVIPTLEKVILNQEPPEKTESFELDILIQEVVNEFIPVLENELRKRLQQIPPETLQQWLKEFSKR